MSLVADYGDSSSSSSSSSSDEDDSDQEVVTQPPKVKLPLPNFHGSAVLQDPEVLKSSVFKNPFAEAENAKEAILQKHVKMVDAKDNVVVINGKKICWNYRKGRCRFGHNCKFAHDSDLHKTEEQLKGEKDLQRQGGVVCQSQTLAQPSAQELEKIRQEALTQNQQKRKRPGLTQGLVPGKKVMRNYMQQKS